MPASKNSQIQNNADNQADTVNAQIYQSEVYIQDKPIHNVMHFLVGAFLVVAVYTVGWVIVNKIAREENKPVNIPPIYQEINP